MHLLHLELKLISRNRWLLISLLLYTLVGCWGLYNGIAQYTYYRAGADSINHQNAANYKSVKAQLDTLKFEPGSRHAIETPFTLDWRLKYMVSRPVNSLSILTIGQNDVNVLHKSARMTQPIFSNDFDGFKNPLQLMAGSFDFTFYFLYLFPLLLIAMVYHIGSYERETGIWPFWQMAGHHRRQMAGRVWIRWLLVLLPPALLFAVAGFNYAKGGSGWVTWLIYAFGYALFWLLIAISIALTPWQGIQRAMVLVACWIMVLVAIPGTVNTFIHTGNPDSMRLDVAAFRDVPEDAWEASMATHRAIFAQRYGDRLKDSTIENNAIVQSYSYLKQTFDAEKQLHNRFVQETRNRYLAEAKTFWFNPAAAFYRAFTGLAATSQMHQLNYEQKLYDLRLRRFLHMFDNMVKKEHYTVKDLEQLPQWQP